MHGERNVKLEHLLLGVLHWRPSTGYDLKKYLDVHGRFVRPNTQMSQVYRCLTALHERGLVTYIEEHRPGAQNAKVFAVTRDGTAVFLDWLTSPYHPPSGSYDAEFEARLMFGGFMSRAQLLHLLETDLVARREQVSKFRNRDRRLDVDPSIPYDAAMADALSDALHFNGAANMDAHIKWVERLVQTIRSGELLHQHDAASADRAVGDARRPTLAGGSNGTGPDHRSLTPRSGKLTS